MKMTAGITNARSVDVEDYFHVAALSRAIDRSDWDQFEFRAEASTSRLLDLYAEFGIKATFFVLGWVAQKYPALIRRVQAAGHEIASHGMSHRLVFEQSELEFRVETRDSKALLEDITGSEVIGYRASTYSITPRSLWALDIICELGFLYDSSIFPIRHDTYGIPDAEVAPSIISSPGGSKIVEFPMSTVDYSGIRVPVSGGGYFRLLPYWLIRSGLRKINREYRRPAIFYLHPWEIDPEQPRINVGLLSRFRHYTNLSATEARLRRLLTEFRFGTVQDVLRAQGLLPDARV